MYTVNYSELDVCLCACQCNDNRLVELPVDIGLLTSLEDLRVNNNKLSQLPVSVSALSRLRRISFASNPLINIPADFPERAADVRQYLSSLQEDPVVNSTVKLVVVGQEGVGKTSLLKAIKRTFWIVPHGYVYRCAVSRSFLQLTLQQRVF